MQKNKIISYKKDFLITLAIALILSIFFINIDAFELYLQYTKEHEDYELDEMLLILFTFSVCGLWFSYKRFIEVQHLKKLLEEDNTNLEKENTKKDALLLEQIKMATLGEMLQNIAHQWRQPLNGISLSASSLLVEESLGSLNSKKLDRSLKNIVKNAEYLSETIDNFRIYIKEDQVCKRFNVNQNIQNCVELVSSTVKNSYINIELDLNADLSIDSFPGELTQTLINIINNASDALIMNNIEEKIIRITSYIKDDYIYIEILDNAGGIDEEILNRVFEPYFSTKEDLNGTGLGLYMSYKLVKERIQGNITVENKTFEYQEKTYTGAEFKITLPVQL